MSTSNCSRFAPCILLVNDSRAGWVITSSRWEIPWSVYMWGKPSPCFSMVPCTRVCGRGQLLPSLFNPTVMTGAIMPLYCHLESMVTQTCGTNIMGTPLVSGQRPPTSCATLPTGKHMSTNACKGPHHSIGYCDMSDNGAGQVQFGPNLKQPVVWKCSFLPGIPYQIVLDNSLLGTAMNFNLEPAGLLKITPLQILLPIVLHLIVLCCQTTLQQSTGCTAWHLANRPIGACFRV